MTRIFISLSYLSYRELEWLKELSGCASFDELIKELAPYMRRGVIEKHRYLHEMIVMNADDILKRQFGGYKPKSELMPESPVE